MITINNMKNFDGTKDIDFHFKGLSTDEKPMDMFGGKEIADNSLFLETDTGDFYYYIKGSKSEEEVLNETYTPTAAGQMYRYENLFNGITGDVPEVCISDITTDIEVIFDDVEYTASPNVLSEEEGMKQIVYGAYDNGSINWDMCPYVLQVLDMQEDDLHGQVINVFNSTGDEHHIVIKAMSGTDGSWNKVAGKE